MLLVLINENESMKEYIIKTKIYKKLSTQPWDHTSSYKLL